MGNVKLHQMHLFYIHHHHHHHYHHHRLAMKNEQLESPLPIQMLALLRANPIWGRQALVSSDFIAPPHTLPAGGGGGRMRDPWEKNYSRVAAWERGEDGY